MKNKSEQGIPESQFQGRQPATVPSLYGSRLGSGKSISPSKEICRLKRQPKVGLKVHKRHTGERQACGGLGVGICRLAAPGKAHSEEDRTFTGSASELTIPLCKGEATEWTPEG